MKKVKKMADGGVSGLGQMVGEVIPEPSMPSLDKGGIGGGGGGGGGGAYGGLKTVMGGASEIDSSLAQIQSGLSGGGGGGGGKPNYEFKKGGQVTTTRRISTGEKKGKSNSNW